MFHVKHHGETVLMRVIAYVKLLGTWGYPEDWPQLEEFVAKMVKAKTPEEIYALVERQITAIRAGYPQVLARLHDDEKQKILIALEQCSYNQSDACERLGISRGTLRNKMKKHGIPFFQRKNRK